MRPRIAHEYACFIVPCQSRSCCISVSRVICLGSKDITRDIGIFGMTRQCSVNKHHPPLEPSNREPLGWETFIEFIYKIFRYRALIIVPNKYVQWPYWAKICRLSRTT